MILYHCNTSYASYKARLYLAEKGLQWEGHHLDLRKQEHLKGDFRKINPNGTVPALADGDHIVCGSTKIQEYLEEKHPQPAMLPTDPKRREGISELLRSHDALHDPHIRTLSYAQLFMNPEKRKQQDMEELLKLAKNHPNPTRGDFLRRAALGQLTEEEVGVARKAIEVALAHLEELLCRHEGPFLFGTECTMGDTVALSTWLRAEELGFEIKSYPTLIKWVKVMKERPSFQMAVGQYL